MKVEKATSVDRFPGGRVAPTGQRALWVTSRFTVFSQKRKSPCPRLGNVISEGRRGLRGSHGDFQNEGRRGVRHITHEKPGDWASLGSPRLKYRLVATQGTLSPVLSVTLQQSQAVYPLTQPHSSPSQDFPGPRRILPLRIPECDRRSS